MPAAGEAKDMEVLDLLGSRGGEVDTRLGKENYERLRRFAESAAERGLTKFWQMQRSGMLKEFPAEMEELSDLCTSEHVRRTKCSLDPRPTSEDVACLALRHLEGGEH